MRRLRSLVLALALGAGCQKAGAPPIDEQLVLALEEARAWQHRADLHLADGDAQAAIADVEHALAVRFPPGSPEGEEAELDAWARLARLHLGPSAADEERALAELARGRARATRDSFYRAHLETVAGEIYEARATRLAATAPEEAKQARRIALAAYARSIAINQHVQAALLAEAQP